jgi:hypothetical protein
MPTLRRAESRQVAVGPPPVDHRRRVLQRSRRRLGVPERHLTHADRHKAPDEPIGHDNFELTLL